ncbi:hypothetical protein JAAARDRAFT_211393 [Jaapia argillacea MUCL 33604]|uniref:Uncharacterized protein n=1 Tax=Jaapia argillacea MUCL 33604 TaxID=933084 RepID=A0A067P882_9AGAM|nr:hypothetical protein JAAARDRAFT_211393 [Jaapia argillacea MUCL 33604]
MLFGPVNEVRSSCYEKSGLRAGSKAISLHPKHAWDAILGLTSTDEAIIELQTRWDEPHGPWLVNIDIARFSPGFGSLGSNHSIVADVFDSFNKIKPSLSKKLNNTTEEITKDLLNNVRDSLATEGQQTGEEYSIIWVSIKSETTQSGLKMSKNEFLSQMKVLLLAGCKTSSRTPQLINCFEPLTNGAPSPFGNPR